MHALRLHRDGRDSTTESSGDEPKASGGKAAPRAGAGSAPASDPPRDPERGPRGGVKRSYGVRVLMEIAPFNARCAATSHV